MGKVQRKKKVQHIEESENKTSKKRASNTESDDEHLNGTTPSKKGRKTPVGKTKTSTKENKSTKKQRSAITNPKNSLDEDDGPDEEYEVEEIVGHKVEKGISYFLVRWKGYTKDDDTWEPENTLSCPELIAKYNKQQSANASNISKKTTTENKKKTEKVKKLEKSERAEKSDKSDETDNEKEWEVEKIIDYAETKDGRTFRIRWKGFKSKHDTWEPEANLNCEDMIEKFMKRMKSQEHVSFKELREHPEKTKRLVTETTRNFFSSPSERKSKRASSKKMVFYGDGDD